MKIVVVVPSIGAESSGPSYSVPGLCGGLASDGCDVSLHFGGAMPNREYTFPTFAYPISKFPHPKFARSPKMLKALTAVVKDADILHTNSLWLFPNIYPALAKRGTKCKLVTAPRGTLASWAIKHHWLQKKLFGWYAQYAAMHATDMWHATCEKEYDEIRALGYRQPVAIVPIGMDLPEVESRNKLNGRNRDATRKKVVFFGRLHKVKAVDNLVLAWGDVAAGFSDWELVIAGPDGGVRGELEAMIGDKHIPRVSFVGEINGQAKYEFLSTADIYVLPSYTENFGVTVAESLACGTPVIASQGTPWSGVETEKAGRWIPVGVEPLAAALREMMSMSEEERSAMGMRGREWMKRDFSWVSIGHKMRKSYDWLLNKKDKPDYVIVD